MGMLTFDLNQKYASPTGGVKKLYGDGKVFNSEEKKEIQPEATVQENATSTGIGGTEDLESEYDSVTKFLGALRSIPATEKYLIARKVKKETGVDLDNRMTKTAMIEQAEEAYIQIYGS